MVVGTTVSVGVISYHYNYFCPSVPACSPRIRLIYRPVRPWTLLTAWLALSAAPDAIEDAELVTRLRPSPAFDVVLDATSFAFEAASAVVDACRRSFRRRKSRLWRTTAREAGATDIFAKAQRASCTFDMDGL